jgi:hypothetical protein
MAMTDEWPHAVQTLVRTLCDRQAAHYLQGSAMANQGLLARIVRMAGPTAGLGV